MFKFVLALNKQNLNGSIKLNRIRQNIIVKSFARREISKGHLVTQNIINNNTQAPSLNISSSTNLKSFNIEDSVTFINNNILTQNVKMDTLFSKFLNEILSDLNKSGLLKNENFLNSLKQISLNYSNNNESFQKSTLFKFLCLIDQIYNKRNLEFYNNLNVTHFVFPHLIDLFTFNFNIIFEKDSQILLNYNFLYFMTINQGEFSEALQFVFEHSKNNILNTKLIFEKSDYNKLNNLLIDKEYFKFVDENIQTPQSDLIKDFSFKYNNKEMKMRLLNQSVEGKKTYEKLKWVFNTLKSLQNFKVQPDSEFMKNLEVFLATNFVENSENIFANEYSELKNQMNDTNKFLNDKLQSLTKLKNNQLKLNVTFENIYEVFNPLFSGETNLVTQFNKVAAAFDQIFALGLIRKYIENILESEFITFEDLYSLKTILYGVKFDSLDEVFKSLRFVNFDMDTINKIEINLKRQNIVSHDGRVSEKESVSVKETTPKVAEKIKETPKVAEEIKQTPKASEKVKETPKAAEKVKETPKAAERLKETPKVDEKTKVREAPKLKIFMEKNIETPKREESTKSADLKTKLKLKETPKVNVDMKPTKTVLETPKVNVDMKPTKTVLETPKVELKEESKVVVKEEPKIVVKEEPKIVVKEEPKVVVKEEPKVEEKEEPKVEENEEPKVELKEEPKVELKEEPKVVVKEEPKVVVKEEPKVEENIKETVTQEQKVSSTHDDEIVENKSVHFAEINSESISITVEEIKIVHTVIKSPPKESETPKVNTNQWDKSLLNPSINEVTESEPHKTEAIGESIETAQEENTIQRKHDSKSIHTDLKRERIPKTQFYKNPRKGFCSDNSSSGDRNPKFIIPPKVEPKVEAKEEIKVEKPKFIIPSKVEVKVEEKVEPKVEQKVEVKKEPKFIIPPKVEPKIEEKIEPKSESKSEPKVEKPKFIIPPKSVTITKKEAELIQPAKKETLKAFDLIENKKKFITPVQDSSKVSEIGILERLDILTKEIQQFQNDNLFSIYKNTNQEGIDIERAMVRYNLDYWMRKIYTEEYSEEMEAEEMERFIHTRIAKIFRKYENDRNKTLMVIYSILNPELKSEFILDLEYSFYQIFSSDETHNIFSKMNLGHLGYQLLLNNCLLDTSIENRKRFEKIINHISKSFYIPNNENIKTIIEICDKNYYPKYLKIIIDNYVLNKNVHLNLKNYTNYVRLITNFEELNEYSTNLIHSSFTDFQIPIQVEFYENILQKYFINKDVYQVENIIKYLKTRCSTDYQNETERMKEMARAMKFIFRIFSDICELSEEKETFSVFSEIMKNVVTDVQFLDQKWNNDLIFTRDLINFYYQSDVEKYLNLIEKYLQESNVHKILNKKDFMNFMNLFTNVQLPREKENSIKNKMFTVLDQFIEEFLRPQIFELNYDEKFKLIREENMYKLFRFFNTLPKTQGEVENTHMKTLQNLLDIILDQITFYKLSSKDKKCIDEHIVRIFENRRVEAVDFMRKIDIERINKREEYKYKHTAQIHPILTEESDSLLDTQDYDLDSSNIDYNQAENKLI